MSRCWRSQWKKWIKSIHKRVSQTILLRPGLYLLLTNDALIPVEWCWWYCHRRKRCKHQKCPFHCAKLAQYVNAFIEKLEIENKCWKISALIIRLKHYNTFHIELYGSTIPNADSQSEKCFNSHIDNKLNWKCHISNKKNQIE